jgi:hypothetical protein
MNEKANLRAFLTSWRGKAFTEEEAKDFDVAKLIGAPCLLNIIHKQGRKDPSKVFDEISSATPIPKGMVCPPQVNPSFEFGWDKGFDKAKFDTIPTFLQEKIKQSEEYKALTSAPAAPQYTKDQIAQLHHQQEQQQKAMAADEDLDELPF